MNVDPVVMVTRSGRGGTRLVEDIEVLGLPAFHIELYRLEAMADTEQVAAQVAEALPADVLVLTSQEGVRQARNLRVGNQLLNLVTVVPGQGTAALAQAVGFLQVFAPEHDGNSEAMLALDPLADVAGKRVLILAASHGRRLIDKVLEQRGAQVRRLDVYRRTALSIPPGVLEQIQSATRLITLLASDGALQSLHEQLDSMLWRKLANGSVLAPSERIAEHARHLGCRRVILTDGASNRAMLDALEVATSSH